MLFLPDNLVLTPCAAEVKIKMLGVGGGGHPSVYALGHVSRNSTKWLRYRRTRVLISSHMYITALGSQLL